MHLLVHSFFPLPGRFNLGNEDVIGFEVCLHVDGRSTLAPERLADGKNPRSFYFAAFDATANECRVLQYGRDVIDGCESPARQHFFELQSDLAGREFFRVEQTRRKDVNMAVPETGSHYKSFAINYGCAARNFDGSAWPNGKNASVMHKD